MRFGIFYEHQLPRPWGHDDEDRLLQTPSSRSSSPTGWASTTSGRSSTTSSRSTRTRSAPEVFLAAASQRTTRDPARPRHRAAAGVQPSRPRGRAHRHARPRVRRPGRVRHRRIDSEAELGGFGVERDDKRDVGGGLDVVPRMLTKRPSRATTADFVMPPRNVVPKPLQRPHPPLWVACSRRRRSTWPPQRHRRPLVLVHRSRRGSPWVDDYYAYDRCRRIASPAGFAADPNLALRPPAHAAHADEATAIDRGLDGEPLLRVLARATTTCSECTSQVCTDVWQEFLENRVDRFGVQPRPPWWPRPVSSWAPSSWSTAWGRCAAVRRSGPPVTDHRARAPGTKRLASTR